MDTEDKSFCLLAPVIINKSYIKCKLSITHSNSVLKKMIHNKLYIILKLIKSGILSHHYLNIFDFEGWSTLPLKGTTFQYTHTPTHHTPTHTSNLPPPSPAHSIWISKCPPCSCRRHNKTNIISVIKYCCCLQEYGNNRMLRYSCIIIL